MIKIVSVSRFPYYQRPFSFGIQPAEVSLPCRPPNTRKSTYLPKDARMMRLATPPKSQIALTSGW